MKILRIVILLFVSFLSSTVASPTGHVTVAGIGINATSDIITRDAALRWCSFNIGLVEYFPRGGTTGGRKAAVRFGPVYDGTGGRITGFTYVIFVILCR
jgi:hypothetical protein